MTTKSEIESTQPPVLRIQIPEPGRAERTTVAMAKTGGIFGAATLGFVGAAFTGMRAGSEIANRWLETITGPIQTDEQVRRAARETTLMVAQTGEFSKLAIELHTAGLISSPDSLLAEGKLFDAIENALFGFARIKVAELTERARIANAALPTIVAESKKDRALVIANAGKVGGPVEAALREGIRVPMAALEQTIVSGAGVVKEGGKATIETLATILGAACGWVGALPMMAIAVIAEVIPPIAVPIPVGIVVGALGGIANALSVDGSNPYEPRFWVSVSEGVLIGSLAGILCTFILGIFAAKFGGFGGGKG